MVELCWSWTSPLLTELLHSLDPCWLPPVTSAGHVSTGVMDDWSVPDFTYSIDVEDNQAAEVGVIPDSLLGRKEKKTILLSYKLLSEGKGFHLDSTSHPENSSAILVGNLGAFQT